MTRLLDRYVLGIFLPALLLFTLTLLFLFIAVDFAAKLNKFMELRGTPLVPFILNYYLVRIPMLLVILIPSVMLFAPAFTVIKLARANEILPIAAAGISLRRMSLPFVLAAILGSAAMALMDEVVLPSVGDEITETEDIFGVRGKKFNVEDYDGKTKLFAREFSVEALILSGEVRITQLNENRQPVEIVSAEECRWDAKRKRWVAFRGVVVRPYELIEVPGEKPQTWRKPIPEEGFVVECALKPETIRRTSGLSARFSFMPLRALTLEMRRFPHDPSKVLKVHQRFSFPLSPLVLLLVGLPFVLDPQSKSFVNGLILSLILALGYYMLYFGCMDMGSRGMVNPVAAAWFPSAAYGLAGLFSFARMRT